MDLIVTFLSRFWGLLMIITSITLIIKKETLKDIFDLTYNKTFVILSGYLSLILGLTTLILYHEWTKSWFTLITFIGYISTIKGIAILGFPEHIKKLTQKIQNNYLLIRILLILTLLLGVVLIKITY